MLAFVLLRLARIWGDDELERRAAGRSSPRPRRAPARSVGLRLGASARSTCTLAAAQSSRSSAIRGADVARAALRSFDPNAVVAFGRTDDVPLLEGKTLVDGQPAVYVCERFACQAPVTDPADLADR